MQNYKNVYFFFKGRKPGFELAGWFLQSRILSINVFVCFLFVHLRVSCIYSFLLVTSSESLHNLVNPLRCLEGVFLAWKA